METTNFDRPYAGIGQMQSEVSGAIARLDAVLEQDATAVLIQQVMETGILQDVIAKALSDMLSGENGVSLIETRIINYLHGGGEEGVSPLQSAIAAYFGSGQENKKGMLPLLGMMFGSEADESSLDSLFAPHYHKYLNGDGEEIVGIIPTAQKALEEIRAAHERTLYGGGEEEKRAIGILPAAGVALESIEKQKTSALMSIEAALKNALTSIGEAVDRAIASRMGGIISYVAGIIGRKDGPSGHYSPGR